MPEERKELTAEEVLKRESPEEITEHDRDPGNLNIRSGFLRALAEVAARPEDRLFLLRASRSLRAYAEEKRSLTPQIQRHAAVCLIERDGRVLTVFNRRYKGWTLPGGRVEDGETPWVAAVRELSEETGLLAIDGKEVYSFALAPVPPHNDRASFVHVFKVDAPGEPIGGEQGCPVCWRTREDFLHRCPFAIFYRAMFANLDALAAGGAS
jgi:8-oxo-dGTP pyrophosphatase MutT (NUDIX family)